MGISLSTLIIVWIETLTYSGAYDMWLAFASDQAMVTIDKTYISTSHITIDGFWKFENVKEKGIFIQNTYKFTIWYRV